MCAVAQPTTPLPKVSVEGCRVGSCHREQGIGVPSQADQLQSTQVLSGNAGAFVVNAGLMPDPESWSFLPD